MRAAVQLTKWAQCANTQRRRKSTSSCGGQFAGSTYSLLERLLHDVELTGRAWRRHGHTRDAAANELTAGVSAGSFVVVS